MKVIVAGSRDVDDYQTVEEAIEESIFKITELVSGGARGVDTIGEYYAKVNNIPVKVFKAEWDRLGKSAGYLRNEQMAEYADALVAIWDGESPGTKHMINIANRRKLHVYVKYTKAIADCNYVKNTSDTLQRKED